MFLRVLIQLPVYTLWTRVSFGSAQSDGSEGQRLRSAQHGAEDIKVLHEHRLKKKS